MLGYRVPRANQAMLISGRKQRASEDGKPLMPRIVIGHGAWYMPGLRKIDMIGLDQHKVVIEDKCRSTEGIMLEIKAVVAFKVQNDMASVYAASQRFLGEQRKEDMEAQTKDVFAGHLRSIIGSMNAIDIHRNRDKLADEILKASQFQMSVVGLTVDSLQLEHLDAVPVLDPATGERVNYFDNIAAETLANAARDAAKAQAVASAESAQAQQEAERKKADQIRETALKKATIKSQVDQAEAEATAAGQLAAADVARQVAERNQAVADTNALLRERQLIVELIKPQEAEARRLRIEADAKSSAAEADKQRAEFEADAEKTRRVRGAEADADKKRLDATASRDAAKLAAEGTRAQGEAEAYATQKNGEATASAKEALGLAEAKGELAKAKALAEQGGVQLELRRIEVQPDIARELAKGLGLQNANLNILNGGEGLVQLVGALAPLMQTLTTLFAPKPSPNGEVIVQSTNDGGRQMAATAAEPYTH